MRRTRTTRLTVAGAVATGAGLLLLASGPGALAAGEAAVGQCLPEQEIAAGISLSCMVQTSSSGGDQPAAGTVIHWSDVDLTAPGVEPVVVAANDRVFQPVGPTPVPSGTQGVDEEVTSMADRTPGVVIGVNGGYFDNNKGPVGTSGEARSYTGVPCGGMVVDGRIVRSPPAEAELNASVYETADGRLAIGHVSFSGTVQVLDPTGAVIRDTPLDSINDLSDAFPQPGCPREHITTPSAGDGITMVTPDMGSVQLQPGTPGLDDPGYEVPDTTEVVQVSAVAQPGAAGEYVVQSVASSAGLQTIAAVPDGQVVLVASTTSGSGEGSFLAGLASGDRLRIPTGLTVDSESAEIVTLLGGVAQVAADGAVPTVPVGYVPGGTNAETVIGLDGTGEHATLLVLDKDSSSPGVTWQQAGQAALDRGATDALLLDGGGSSTLVAQLTAPAVYPDGQPSRVTVVNTPQNDGNFPEGDFTQRLVGNGLFFTGLVPSPSPATPVPPTPGPSASPALAATGHPLVPGSLLLGGALVVGGLATLLRRRRSASDRG